MYRLYVDEVGTDDLTSLDKDPHRFLSLTGVAIHRDHNARYLVPELERIKTEVFGHDPDTPLILHRKEIMGFKGPFEILRDEDKKRQFNHAILDVFANCDYTVITALIDKVWMLEQRHWTKNHPYNYLMEIIAEKYARFLVRKNSHGDIMPEARQSKKDVLLQDSFKEVRERGTDYCPAATIQERIKSVELKFRRKKDNVAGLQLCDLLAHPSHIYTRVLMGHNVDLGPFANKVVDHLIERKYDRGSNGRVSGYGIKHLP